ncbi:MAG: nitroreductase family protein [Ardenticatenaceae bacterium]|nr:nitroreductase family protein [Ardenticatenaceae bacterium]
MDVFEAVKTVLAVRSYEKEPIPSEVVAQIVEAGRLTGSSMNRQPWHFVVMENRETLSRLGNLARSGPYIAEAPLAIAVAIEKESIYGVSDASRAIQSMVLTAWGAGVGSNWVGFKNLSEVAALLGVPDSFELLAVLSFGYPTRDLGKGKKQRKPLGTIASREKFGQPFE